MFNVLGSIDKNASVNLNSPETNPETELRIFPNPANHVFNIGYKVPESGKVVIQLRDSMNKEIAVLIDEIKEAGEYEINYDGAKLHDGMYFCTMQTKKFRKTHKIVILKQR